MPVTTRTFRRALLSVGLLAPGVGGVHAAAATPAPASCTSWVGAPASGFGTAAGSGNRYVVSAATDDAALADTNGVWDIVLTDRVANTRVVVSRGVNGAQANAASKDPVVTPDGRYVAFTSTASNLVAGDTNNAEDTFVRDVQSSTTERVSVDSNEAQASSGGSAPFVDLFRNGVAISDDGRYVAFTSKSGVLNPSAPNADYLSLFVRDRTNGTTSMESVDGTGTAATGGSSFFPSLSSDGRYISFSTLSPTFGGEALGTNHPDVVVRDRQAGTNDLVSGGEMGHGYGAMLSDDGRTVAFVGTANLVGGTSNDENLRAVVSDRSAGTYENLSDNATVWPSETAAITGDGRYAAFTQSQPVPGTSYSARVVVMTDRQTNEKWVGSDVTKGDSVSPLSLAPDGSSVAYTAASRVTVTPTRVPSFDGITLPNIGRTNLRQGDTHQQVYANGFNLAGGTFDLGTGVTVHSVTYQSIGQAALDVSVAPDAPTGDHAASVSANGCSAAAAHPVHIDPAVTMGDASPNTIRLNASRTITLTGTGFVSGGTVSVSGGGVTATNVTVTDNTHVSFTATSGPDAQPGVRNITWTNVNGTTGVCVGCLAVDNKAPKVLYVGPSNKTLEFLYVGITDDRAVNESATSIGVFRNNVKVPFTRRTVDTGIIELHLTNPSDGQYVVKVIARDTAGNAAPLVSRTVERGEQIVTLNAYGAFQGGAETTAGDVTGDGKDEIITAAGPGGGPHVRVFRVNALAHTTTEIAGFMAYDPSFTGGVRVAAADVDGDGIDEIITAPGPGGGPDVRVWHVQAKGGAVQRASFFAYAPDVKVGLSISAGDVDGDGIAEVITAPGPGAGPHIRAFSISGGTGHEVAGFMAYDPAFTGGVRVTALDVNGDGYAEIATGAGPGGGPHVQVFVIDDNYQAQAVASFMAYDPAFTGGVVVSSGDFNGDWYDELLVSAGGGGGPHVRVLAFDPSGVIYEAAGFMAYDPNFHGGVSAAGGDVDGDGDDDVITTPGPGMPVQIVARRVI